MGRRGGAKIAGSRADVQEWMEVGGGTAYARDNE
jgi:hypothetical protein